MAEESRARPTPPRFTPFGRSERDRMVAFQGAEPRRIQMLPGSETFQREARANELTAVSGPAPARPAASPASPSVPSTAQSTSQVDQELLAQLPPEERALVEALMSGGDQTGPEVADDVLGSPFLDENGRPGPVPNSFFARRNPYLPESDRRLFRSRDYRRTDVAEQWARLPLEKRVHVSQQLKQLGFISVANGAWSPQVGEGITAAMAYANTNGLSWTGALDSLARQAVQLEETTNREARQRVLDQYNYLRDNFLDDPYLPPDYDTIAQDVRSLFHSRLGRRPEDWEIELLAETFTASHRAQWEANDQADREVQLANLAAQANADLIAQGLKPEIEVPGVSGTGATLEDPSASLAEVFERTYSSAIDTEAAEGDTAAEGALIDGTNLVRRLVGG